MDKSWMRTSRTKKQYIDGVEAFIKYAVHNLQKMRNIVPRGNKQYLMMPCPCTTCLNHIEHKVEEAKTTNENDGTKEQKDTCSSNNCIYNEKDNKELTVCPTCGISRWKVDNKTHKVYENIPAKVMWYFPIIPRLQRLFKLESILEDLRWHATRRITDGVLRHPADSQAWRTIDEKFPKIAKDPRNLRLGISADGVDVNSGTRHHSVWPVLSVIYNLPPWLCMKRKFIMLSVLISGYPGNDIDVFLEPLVDDLHTLFETGVDTYDASTKENFNLRVVVLWTINDYPALGTLCGCPYSGFKGCVENEQHKTSENQKDTRGRGGKIQKQNSRKTTEDEEKNVGVSLVGTLLNVPGKTKDGVNTRLDLLELGIKPELFARQDEEKTTLPPAGYTLTNAEKDIFCEMLSNIRRIQASRSLNDAHVDDADIRPIDNEEPMAEVQTTADDNVSATGQQHTEQPEFNNEGKVDQNAEQCHDIRPLPAKLTDNMTTKLSDQLLESENVCLKKTVAQFQKYFGKLEAHCINLELQLQMENNVLKSGQQSQFLKEKGNEAKVKNDIDTYKDLFDSIKRTRVQTKNQNDSLMEQLNKKSNENADVLAQIQKKGFAIAALKNELRKLTGNSVNTKFAKPSILGKPVLGQTTQKPIRKTFASSTTKVESEPLNGSNADIPNQCESEQALNVMHVLLLMYKYIVLSYRGRTQEFADQASVFMAMTSVHISSGLVLHQMMSDHNSSDLAPQRQEMSVENVSSGLVPQGQKASDYDNSDPVPPRQNVVPTVEKSDSSQQGLEFLSSFTLKIITIQHTVLLRKTT
ncbi:putative transposon, En/Spm-like protein [Tanacetum coccineum]